MDLIDACKLQSISSSTQLQQNIKSISAISKTYSTFTRFSFRKTDILFYRKMCDLCDIFHLFNFCYYYHHHFFSVFCNGLFTHKLKHRDRQKKPNTHTHTNQCSLLKSGRCLRVLNLQKVGASIEITDNKISYFLFSFLNDTLTKKQKYTYINNKKQNKKKINFVHSLMNRVEWLFLTE